MLCPTGAMNSIFSLFPVWLTKSNIHSYRSVITLLVFLIGPLISISYIKIAMFIEFMICSVFGKRVVNVDVNNIIKKK